MLSNCEFVTKNRFFFKNRSSILSQLAICMRKTALKSPRNLHLLLNRNPSCNKYIRFISTRILHVSDQLDGEKTVHQRLIHLLKEPSHFDSIDTLRVLHGLTLTIGPYFNQHMFLFNNIMFRYVSLGEVFLARKVFDKMVHRNVVSYNTMIKAYCCNGFLEEGWRLFSEMRYCGLKLTEFTVCGVLSCGSMSVVQGFQLMGMIVKSGVLYNSAFVGTAMLGMLGTHGCLDEGVCVFEDMPVKNLVTYNCMISMFGQFGFVEDSVLLLLDLIWSGIELSGSTFVGFLSGLREEQYLGFGEQIHGFVKKHGFDSLTSVSNSLMNMYFKCGNDIQLAEKMFQEIPFADIVSWNAIIGSTAKGNMQEKVFSLLLRMCQEGIFPSETTFLSVLSSLNPNMSSYGQYIHAKILKLSLESDTFLGSALVDFYAKSDNMEDAHLCFHDISEKNIVSWNSLISGFTDKDPCVSLLLLQKMIHSGCQPNEYTFSAVVNSCPVLEVQQLHSLITKMGYLHNNYVSSSIISAYARNGHISSALTFADTHDTPLHVVPSNVIAGIYNRTGQYEKTQDLYSTLEDPDNVSWNILIAACSRNGDYKEAFDLFAHMLRYEIIPDNYTYVSLFSICTKICNLALGSSLHDRLIKTDFNCCDVFVRNIMIDMYGKCGSLESSLKIFYEMPLKNAISWTAIISSLGLHGYAYEALEHFKMMEMEGFSPNKVTFITVISACRHVGLVDEGMELFEQMKWKYGIEPERDHYRVTVDLLARNGLVKEAEKLIDSMPFPADSTIWRSLIGGYSRISKSKSKLHDQVSAI